LFTNGEFHDAGVPYFIGPGKVDRGRHQGIIDLKKSPFTLASDYSDDPKKSGAWKVNKVATLHVIAHYSNIDIERLHADGEAILKPLNLSQQEIEDLVSFLETL